MRAMILAAGRGERLRPLTYHTPKPMLEVGGRPLLAHQLEWLRRAGIRDVVINLHHLGEQIETRFEDGSKYGVHISYSRELELLETGGGIAHALPLLGEEPFLVLNGDIFTDFPLVSLQPIPEWADVHLLLTPKPAFRAEGDFESAGGRATARGDSYVYCGISLLRPELFGRASRVTAATSSADAAETEAADGTIHPAGSKTPFSLRDLFFSAVASSQASAQIWPGYWIDIGSIEQLEAANIHAKHHTLGNPRAPT